MLCYFVLLFFCCLLCTVYLNLEISVLTCFLMQHAPISSPDNDLLISHRICRTVAKKRMQDGKWCNKTRMVKREGGCWRVLFLGKYFPLTNSIPLVIAFVLIPIIFFLFLSLQIAFHFSFPSHRTSHPPTSSSLVQLPLLQ